MIFGLTGMVLLALFFLPMAIAAMRGVKMMGVILVNCLLGWTGVGWLVALIWALTDKPISQTPVNIRR